ncbi:MAG TPA: very short patch repair endonuclease [Desulfovibrio sp.]|uniref:very short patch repair endonuclease n=1 Tax=Desulfovibrio sp. TaxID=885 RepID=UPI002BD4B2A4|nr:very short patch repair endonuclease [Desulfovibrio sp.]HMM37281.1 very short patch repair endonuclease [Desulfovibrio sp.]
MTDTLTPHERSERMSQIRGKDSSSEMRLRRLIHSMGFRYRLHVKTLPGTPDLVFSAKRAVIFMHGCFWHRHQNCRLSRMPKSRVHYWHEKFEANRRRDNANISRLNELGWRVLVIWECQIKAKNLNEVSNLVKRFLGDGTTRLG